MLPQAVLPLLMNTLIASMFVASFLTIAYLNPSVGRTRWMALSYGFGVLEPVSRLAAVMGADAAVVRTFAPCTFLIGLTLMAPALSIFHRKPPMWPACAAIILPGLLYYCLDRSGRTDWFWHELAFQSFFAASMFLCALTVRRDVPRSAINRMLTIVFTVAAFHFLLKPVVASQFGVDGIDSNYARSLYAVFSQASSGVLLVAAGLLILIFVLQSVVQINHEEAHTDALTGLPNRRALFEAFRRLSSRIDVPVMSIAMIDLDRFKAINDRLGHERGDQVLRLIADCLQRTRPSTAVAARIGGEEFALILPGCDREPARLICESVRVSISGLSIPDLPTVTVSVGLTVVVTGEDLSDALRRADRALYTAKHSGRDRCVVACDDEGRRRPHLTVV